MKTNLLTVVLGLFLSFGSIAQNTQSEAEASALLQKADHLLFIENQGQWHSDVLYLCRMSGLDVWITKYGVNYTFYQVDTVSANRQRECMPRGEWNHEISENSSLLGHRVFFELQGHKPSPESTPCQRQRGYYNYFTGNVPDKHAASAGLYKEVIVKDVYEGIDIRYYFDKEYLRYDFVVHPGADPKQIAFRLKGQYKTYLKEGALCYTTRFGEVQMTDLHTYQDDRTVDARFNRQGDIWTIEVGAYDTGKKLVIDPLVYSTYLGGGSRDAAYSLAVDAAGNAYVTGITISSLYDTTPGAYQTIGGGDNDVFVTKLNATGTALVYSTFIGGNGYDIGNSITVDSAGNVYLGGGTNSFNYPTTPGAYQTTRGGGYDAFVTKLNATGTALIYSTYVGGVRNDFANAIVIDSAGNIYIAGRTDSFNYPTTPGAYQAVIRGSSDAFVTKLNATGTALVYSTYLGGNSYELAEGIAVDNAGNAYVVGYTYSIDYPTTPGAYQTTSGGSYDAFVTKLNITGTALVYSTYLGGNSYEFAEGIAVDNAGNAYVVGYTYSIDYPTTPGAYQTTSGGSYDAFVTKLNATGTALVYSTYLGGTGVERANAIFTDASGNIYVAGEVNSSDYPITPGAYQSMNRGSTDAFITKLNITGTALVYSTYLGGTGADRANAIFTDASGNIYVAGEVNSSDYPTTPGAYQATREGSGDVFVTKLDPGFAPLPIDLLSFYGHAVPAGAVLYWQTATEAGNDCFFILRSRNGFEWEEVGQVKGAGNANQIKEYTFADEQLPAGDYYYRLKYGHDGEYEYSNIIFISIKSVSSGMNFTVYPNPSRGEFFIQSEEDGFFELTDAYGRLLNIYATRGKETIVQERLPAGVYYLREKYKGRMQKIVIERKVMT